MPQEKAVPKRADKKPVPDSKVPRGMSPGYPEYGYKKCPHICNLVPTNVPSPEKAQAVLHPRKDVFVLKVAKVGPNGDRRTKIELELVTPTYHTNRPVYRVDTRDTQCEPEPCCCCMKSKRKRK